MEQLREIKERYNLTGTVEVSYQGSGDSGCIENVSGLSNEEAETAIEDISYGLLERFPGWEINDGSSGTIVIDFDKCTVGFNHTEYYTESRDCPEESQSF